MHLIEFCIEANMCGRELALPIVLFGLKHTTPGEASRLFSDILVERLGYA